MIGAARLGRWSVLAAATTMAMSVVGPLVAQRPPVPIAPAVRSDDAVTVRTNALLSDLEPGAATDSIRVIILAASSHGVPPDPLLTKVREGIAKRSPPTRIRDAVGALAARLAAAREALAPVLSIDEANAGAGAMQMGVAAPSLREMRRIWPATSLAVPLGVVTELVVDGVTPSQAAMRVRELMAHGARASELVALGATVREDVASGIAAKTAFEARSKRVLSLLANSTVNSLTQPIRPERPTTRPPRIEPRN